METHKCGTHPCKYNHGLISTETHKKQDVYIETRAQLTIYIDAHKCQMASTETHK